MFDRKAASNSAKTADLAVIGAGPAALALAASASELGLRVSLAAPAPTAPWPASYGLWDREEAWLPPGVVEARYPHPKVDLGRGERIALDRTYLRLDTGALQAALLNRVSAKSVDVLASRVLAVSPTSSGSLLKLDGHSGELAAAVVVDASGAATRLTRRRGDGASGYQVAYGELLEVDEHPYGEGEMALMDFGADFDGQPTFLYAMPVGPQRLFVEETVLATDRVLPMAWLRRRLHQRLVANGVVVRRRLERERCVIPLGLPLPARGQPLVAFGAAASLVQPSSGYQLGHALALAPQIAEVVATGLGRGDAPQAVVEAAQRTVWPADKVRAWALYRFGMRALWRLDLEDTRSFLRAFFSLPADDWQRFMMGQQSSPAAAMTMLRVFLRSPWRLRRALAGFASQPDASLPRRELAQESKR